MLSYISFDRWMCALVFSIASQEIGLGKCPRNDLFCVEWNVEPQLSLSRSVLMWMKSYHLSHRVLESTSAFSYWSVSFQLMWRFCDFVVFSSLQMSVYAVLASPSCHCSTSASASDNTQTLSYSFLCPSVCLSQVTMSVVADWTNRC